MSMSQCLSHQQRLEEEWWGEGERGESLSEVEARQGQGVWGRKPNGCEGRHSCVITHGVHSMRFRSMSMCPHNLSSSRPPQQNEHVAQGGPSATASESRSSRDARDLASGRTVCISDTISWLLQHRKTSRLVPFRHSRSVRLFAPLQLSAPNLRDDSTYERSLRIISDAMPPVRIQRPLQPWRDQRRCDRVRLDGEDTEEEGRREPFQAKL